jgi:heme a synthase
MAIVDHLNRTALQSVTDERQIVSAAETGAAAIRVWLYVMAGLVFAMVIVGGATRLTNSGLSITEWKPILGSIPPLSDADWQTAFAKYKLIPQYEILNKGMSLAAFKFIYWWEWGHRQLGRFIGVAFFIPFVVFWARGQISRAAMPKLVGLFLLGGLQGAAGWYMVQSGLADRIDVSQYRLALHLTIAVAIFAGLLWVAWTLDVAPPDRSSNRQLLLFAQVLTGLVFLQVALGGLVAGLKAGLAHNTWPLMDGRFIPSGLDAMTPGWRNLFENVLTVQFNHRITAYAIALGGAFFIWRALSSEPSVQLRRTVLWLGAAIAAQILLGIWTLVSRVPLSLGLLHQAGALVVLGLLLRAAFVIKWQR